MAKPSDTVKALILGLSQNPRTKGGFLQMRGLLRLASPDALQDENFCKAAISALEKFLEQEGYQLPQKLKISVLQKVTWEVILMMILKNWSKAVFEEGGREIFLNALFEVRNYLVLAETERPLGAKLEEIFDYINQLPT